LAEQKDPARSKSSQKLQFGDQKLAVCDKLNPFPEPKRQSGVDMPSQLIIRAAQMRVLEEAFLIEWVRAELKKLFPKQCAAKGPAGLRRFISEGQARAHRLELTRNDLLPYLSMEICFGEAFLDDPADGWARQALEGPLSGRMQRLRRAGIYRLAARVERERRQQAAWAEARAQQEAEEEAERQAELALDNQDEMEEESANG
jgi:hypothetical protein